MTDELIHADTIVLDLDGVLVDVSNSYRKAIKETVRRNLDTEPSNEFLDDSIQKLKDAGGFNNDWDVTYALALILMAHEQGLTDDPDKLFRVLSDRGGGLDTLARIIRNYLTEEDFFEINRDWNKENLRANFQQLYLGSELYEKFEDEDPAIECDGYINDEPVLISDRTAEWLNKNFSLGLLTGRPRKEASVALNRISLELPSDAIFTMEDWDRSKPDPDALLRIAKKYSSKTVVFVGDTLDDVRTAVQANKEESDRNFHGIGVLTGGLEGENGREKFKQAGADGVIEDINQVTNYVRSR